MYRDSLVLHHEIVPQCSMRSEWSLNLIEVIVCIEQAGRISPSSSTFTRGAWIFNISLVSITTDTLKMLFGLVNVIKVGWVLLHVSGWGRNILENWLEFSLQHSKVTYSNLSSQRHTGNSILSKVLYRKKGSYQKDNDMMFKTFMNNITLILARWTWVSETRYNQYLTYR